METILAIFASGNGSNAQRIIEHFRDKPGIQVCAVFCNKPDAYVIERAKTLEVPSVIFSASDLRHKRMVLDRLQDYGVTHIVLAGFLLFIPDYLLNAYRGRIINIHPALLPKYGGKGMYGHHVHEAVLTAGEKESGISIHLVDEIYDHGTILFQARCPVMPGDKPETLAKRIHLLEHQWYPLVIEKWVTGEFK